MLHLNCGGQDPKGGEKILQKLNSLNRVRDNGFKYKDMSSSAGKAIVQFPLFYLFKFSKLALGILNHPGQ